jgi:hypothetical protein
MKKIFFMLVMLISSAVFAQSRKPALENFLNQCVLKGISSDAFVATPENCSHFYAISFSFDKEGKIDTLFYSNKINPDTKQLFNLNESLLKRIKSQNLQYKEYAAQLVLIPFYHYKISDKILNYDSGFLSSLENMIPQSVYGKPIIILKPMINPYTIHNN